MSTFKGCLEEFPDIRIDYFREIAGRRPPLACFLSHIHSDHIQGLDSLASPFVYCSPATRELLLNLEKYPQRMNLAKGYLECRKLDYKPLKKLLKTIPLNAPTEIELKPGVSLRVTLLDANHCAGAVMFLIEEETKAILYTGDIRSEPWWVNSLIRNPVVLPYTHGHKRLDMVYLDTTFASEKTLCRKFPTKAEGLKELLDKVMMYPKGTVFHLHAWTPGYEDVWIALSGALRSQIHVDDYKSRLYRSLARVSAGKNPNHEGPALFGFRCGNRNQAGCLTNDQNVRLHSCERGTKCAAVNGDDVVFITPIISRSTSGAVIPEVGAGGGGGDLELQALELELDDEGKVSVLMKLCSGMIVDHELRKKTLDFIDQAKRSQKRSLSLNTLPPAEDQTSFIELAQHLTELAGRDGSKSAGHKLLRADNSSQQGDMTTMERELPRTIEFPYSRHSSYEELCALVQAFLPTDVYPCTVDEENWGPEDSVEHLFGRFCSGTTFVHDRKMELLSSRRLKSRSEGDGPEDGDESQSFNSLREGSVESQLAQDEDTVHGDLERSSSDPTPYLRLPSEPNQQAKRRRLGPPLSDKDHGSVDVSRKQLHKIKKSFQEHLRRKQGKTDVSDRLDVVGVTHYTEQNGLARRSGAILPNGTQAEPIELSDSSSSSADDDVGALLLGEMPAPNSISHTAPASQSGPETQISISDAAFESASESQSPHHPQSRTIGVDRVRRRKEAYKAAKDLNGNWETGHALVSSFDGHGEEELEL